MKTEQEDEPTKVQGDIKKCDLSKNEKKLSECRNEKELKRLNESLILAQDERWRRA